MRAGRRGCRGHPRRRAPTGSCNERELGLRLDTQRQRETRAAARPRADDERGAVNVGDRLAERESEPGAARRGGAPTAVERLEDARAFMLARADAAAAVRDTDEQPLAGA